jgi:hypothetical protein
MVQNEINLLQSLNKVARELIENDFCNNKKIYHLLNYKRFLKKGEKLLFSTLTDSILDRLKVWISVDIM